MPLLLDLAHSAASLFFKGATEADGDRRRLMEINALCVFSYEPCHGSLQPSRKLVLLPADERLDLRWLALVLNVPRRRVGCAPCQRVGYK